MLVRLSVSIPRFFWGLPGPRSALLSVLFPFFDMYEVALPFHIVQCCGIDSSPRDVPELFTSACSSLTWPRTVFLCPLITRIYAPFSCALRPLAFSGRARAQAPFQSRFCCVHRTIPLVLLSVLPATFFLNTTFVPLRGGITAGVPSAYPSFTPLASRQGSLCVPRQFISVKRASFFVHRFILR